jgi:hypothetical protein
MTNKIYIGNTQQNLKKRMAGQLQDIKKLMEKGVHSDSYARHFTGIWPRGAASLSPGMKRDLITCNILWKGNPISAINTFGKSTSVLCATERGWRSVNSPKRSPNYLSILAPRITEHADTSQGFIGITNRNPVLMSAISAKSHPKYHIPQKKKKISFDTYGSESIGSHSHLGTEPYGFTSV